ncbi:MAG TPA: gephyrin-like molybdotransferase Glp [Candidatus Angelobacter sp.]|nr:gephyrin-like molybdotransferase Glp [Candidatus Angelobacter sp.]
MTTASTSIDVLTFEQADQVVRRCCEHVATPQSEPVKLLDSLGRVLAESVAADRDFPPFQRSTRDGYAVRAADVSSVPVRLKVVGQIKAGGSFSGSVNSGEAVEIMTGAALPAGADAVVMVEHTSAASNESASGNKSASGSESAAGNESTSRESVEIRRAVKAGENFVPAGAEAHAGDVVLSPGARITPAHIAMLAAVGRAKLSVYRRPRVAVLSTGDELVDVTEAPGPEQIRNSNSYSLCAQVMQAGGEPLQLPVAPDEERKLTTLMHAGLDGSDLLLLSGGVSMGKFDLVEQALSKLGAQFFFTGALIQPGRPVVFGEIRKNSRALPFFGLPGNPVSVMTTFDLFVRPLLDALAGAPPRRTPSAGARLKKAFKTKTGLTRFLPAILEGGLYDPVVEVVPWQGSGDLLAAAKANCYVVIPRDRETIEEGEMLTVVMR